ISHVQQLAFESATTGSGPSPFFVQSGREAEDGSNDDLRKGNPGAALVVIHGNCFSGGMAVIRAIVRLAKRSFSSYWINSAQALEGLFSFAHQEHRLSGQRRPGIKGAGAAMIRTQ